MVKLYTEKDLGAIVAGEWELVGGLGARVDSGMGVTATLRELPDPVWKHAHDIALPFPFTLTQFRTFCAWHPTFEWEAVEAPFTNDDGSLDEDALTELALRGADAAELVRLFLAGETDVAATENKAAQQDAPASNKVWTDEKKAEMSVYREKYGTKKTAEQFEISEQRVRQLLPRGKPSATPFSGLGNRK